METSRTPKSSTFAFEPGQWFSRGDVRFRIAEDRAPLLVIEHRNTLERKVVDKATLEREFLHGLIVPSSEAEPAPSPLACVTNTAETVTLGGIPLDMCSTAQQDHVTGVLGWINVLRGLGYRSLRPRSLIELDFDRQKIAHPELPAFALSTIYHWSLKLDKADGDARAIRPSFDERGGRGLARTAEEFESALAAVFDDLREDETAKIEAHDVEDRVNQRLTVGYGKDRALALMGSRSTISRRIEQNFTAYFIARRNKGQAAADREFRNWYPRDAAEYPLEVVEFDDFDSGLFLIDDRTGLPHGRAHVTSGVDQNTGVPMGFSISELPRSTWSAISAVTNAILPKDLTGSDFERVTSGVEFSGKLGIGLFDNATYNHANEINLAGHEIGFTAAWAKPWTPTEKATEENFNGRMRRDFFAKQTGYRGPKGSNDGLKQAVESANASRDDVVRDLMKWVYDDYCNAPGPTGLSRRQLWHQGMQHFKPRYPWDIYRLRIAPTLRHLVKLRPEGIRFCGLIFFNDRLKKLQHTIGATAEVEFRYHPRELSQIYVFDKLSRQLFIVPSANPEYTSGLTLYQHRLLRKMARARGARNPAIPQLMAEREVLRTLVQQARWSKKKRERVMANRVGEVPGSKTTTAQKSTTLIVTDLEGQVGDIDDVEMEALEEGWEVPEMV